MNGRKPREPWLPKRGEATCSPVITYTLSPEEQIRLDERIRRKYGRDNVEPKTEMKGLRACKKCYRIFGSNEKMWYVGGQLFCGKCSGDITRFTEPAQPMVCQMCLKPSLPGETKWATVRGFLCDKCNDKVALEKKARREIPKCADCGKEFAPDEPEYLNGKESRCANCHAKRMMMNLNLLSKQKQEAYEKHREKLATPDISLACTGWSEEMAHILRGIAYTLKEMEEVVDISVTVRVKY